MKGKGKGKFPNESGTDPEIPDAPKFWRRCTGRWQTGQTELCCSRKKNTLWIDSGREHNATVNNPPAPGDATSKDNQKLLRETTRANTAAVSNEHGHERFIKAVLNDEVETHILDNNVSPRIKNRTKGSD